MAGYDNNDSNAWVDNDVGYWTPRNQVEEKGIVIGLKGDVQVVQANGSRPNQVNNGDVINMGDRIITGVDSAVVLRFTNGSLLTLGHDQTAMIDRALVRDLQGDNVAQVADTPETEEIDFEKLQEGLEQGLNLEELLPATAAGGAPGAGGGAGGSSGTGGVRFDYTGDETIPDAGFETGTFSNAFEQAADEETPDTAPEAVDDFDEVTSVSVATGNVVTGIDAGADANSLDGNADDPGANGFGTPVVVGVQVGDTQTDLTDGSGVALEISSGKGELLLNGDGSYTYTPERSASGEDVFTYTIVDSDGDVSSATLTIDIDGIPDVTPPANDPENPDNSAGTTVFEAGLSDGSGELADGDPANNSDAREVTSGTINFIQGDGPATVSIGGVTVVADGTQQADSVSGSFGTLQITAVTDTSISYSYTLSGAVDHSSGAVAETFAVAVVDSDGSSADDASEDLVITIVDDSPIAAQQSDAVDATLIATGNVLTAVDIAAGDANASDGEADLIGADLPGQIQGVVPGIGVDPTTVGVGVAVTSANGTLVLNADGSYTYTANAGAFGDDVFTYTVVDADGSTDLATLTINTDAANTLADASETASAEAGQTISGNVLANTTNTDGPEAATVTGFTVAGTAFNPGDTAPIAGVGTITISTAGAYSFVPATGFSGVVPTISYTVSDTLNTDTSTLSLTIIDPDVPPLALDDVRSAAFAGSTVLVSVLGNDSDSDGFLLPGTVSIVGAPGDGSLLTVAGQGVWAVESAGAISFSPEQNFIGNPTPIQYQVSDDDGLVSNAASVTVSYQANVTVTDVSVLEGNEAVFSVQVSNANAGDVVALSLSDGAGANGATRPADYGLTTFSYSLDSGATYNPLVGNEITLSGGGNPLILVKTDTSSDDLFEGAESFNLNATLTSDGITVNDTGVGTITDADTVPELSVSDITVAESDSFAVFTAALSNPTSSDVNFNISLDNTGLSSAASPSGVDYGSAGSGNLQVFVGGSWQDATGASIPAGQSSIQIRTPINNDVLDEPTEQFNLILSSISNTTNSSASANAQIIDDDSPNINVGEANSGTGDVSVEEGTDAIFGVVVTSAAQNSTVTLALSDGSAAQPLDFNGGNPEDYQYRLGNTGAWVN
ncbi:MAG: retention module-containing protein, partial [Cellvibrionaceae bacterium]|nr:retention module-containing protein [Cellvibrionaceae bacterium]